MKKIIILLLVLLAYRNGFAQVVTTGKIEFERKVNIQAQFAEMEENEWINQMKAKLPKFMSSYFDLSFDQGKSIYKPGRKVELEGAMKMFGSGPASENIVMSEFGKDTVHALKTVFESKFYVTDTLRKLDWQEKDDIRTIAGFKCHKAVSKICDSVYVVAFYTEDIGVSGGPEMFGGLPGMILELAVPRLHTTWVATKVEMTPTVASDFVVPDKGKKVTQKELYESVKESFKMWGKIAPRNTWWVCL